MSDDKGDSDNESWRSELTCDAVVLKYDKMNLAERWLRLFKTGNWSDCSFQAGQPDNQQKFECHALVLASCSPVFEAMLLGPMAEKKFPILIPDVSPDTFSILVNFAYTGKVEHCNFTQALEVCMAADKYQMEGVLEVCVDLLCDGLNPENVFNAFELADQHSIQKLKEYCIRILQDNTAQIISSPSFKECSPELVLLLLQQDQLCANEQQLTNAVMEWATIFLEEESTEVDIEKPTTDTKESEICVSNESKPCSSQEIKPSTDTKESKTNEPKPCSSQEIKCAGNADTDMNTGGHNLRKRKCKKAVGNRKIKIQKKYQPPPYTEKEKARGLQLRKILGPALQNMRFLSPSFNLDEFLKTFPCVLTLEEVSAIIKTRQAHEKTIGKSMKHGPWNSERDYARLPQITKAVEKLVQKQNENPLPNSLFNKFNERYAPFKSSYRNDKGEEIEFKFSPLTLSNRVPFRNGLRLSGDFEIYPSQTIVCYGIQLPSQLSPDAFSPSSLMYRESMYIDAKCTDGCLSSGMLDYSHVDRGRMHFNELVPYNSTITIMFAKPFEINCDIGALIEISHDTSGNYPCDNTVEVVTTGEVSIRISKARNYLPGQCFIQGLLFESRSKDCKKLTNTWEGFHGPDLDDQSMSGVDEDWSSHDDDDDYYNRVNEAPFGSQFNIFQCYL